MHDQHAVSVRAVLVGLSVGVLMCMTNMYFGLQTGWVTMGSLQSAILGFGIFKVMQACGLGANFTVAENVIVQTTSVATATMPLAAGFVGVIPAMGMLTRAENPPDGPYSFTSLQLIAWSLALALFGVFAAIPLRQQVIEREQLRFPSGTATAEVIRTLHAAAPSPGVEENAVQLRKNAGISASVMAYAGSCSNSVQPFFARKAARTPRGGEASRLLSDTVPALPACRQRSAATLSPQVRPEGHCVRENVEMTTTPSKAAGLPEVVDIESYPAVRSATQRRGWMQADAPPATTLPRVASSSQIDDGDANAGLRPEAIRTTWAMLGGSFGVSFAATTFTATLDALGMPSQLPLGDASFTRLGWRLGVGAGYVGQGMIMGPRVCASMLGGAIIGFAVLAPIALARGWVDSDDPDEKAGAAEQRAIEWVSWVSLSIMITDSLTSLAVLLMRYALAAAAAHFKRERRRPPRALDYEQIAQNDAHLQQHGDGGAGAHLYS